MRAAELPPDETARLQSLWSLDLLDSAPDERFDRITRLAQTLFKVPIALVSLVDEQRQWFKSRQGLDATETSREMSFCAHAILGNDIFQVADASLEPDFADNPLVLEDPRIRFYAGCPIKGPDGHPLGTLCLIDRTARSLTDEEATALRDLAGVVEQELYSSRLATIDELTGLANRRGFEALARKLLEVARRQLIPASMLCIDLDDFKEINDTFGHDAGDAALRELGDLLATVFRGSDLVARVGGDEFAALLTDARAETAVSRLRAAMDARNRSRRTAFELHASIGWADFEPVQHDTLERLMCRADAAMYVDKRRTHCRDRAPVADRS